MVGYSIKETSRELALDELNPNRASTEKQLNQLENGSQITPIRPISRISWMCFSPALSPVPLSFVHGIERVKKKGQPGRVVECLHVHLSQITR